MTEKLHDDIIGALDHDFVRRMDNWARSLDGSSVGTCSKLWGNVGGGSYEARVPVLMGEARDTDRAIRALPQRYQEVVTIFWTNRSQTLAWMATSTARVRLWRLGPASFGDWLELGHARLIAILAGR